MTMNKIYDNKWLTLLVALFLALTMFVFVKAERYNDNPISFFQNVSENSTETISNVPVHIKGNVQNYYITGLPETVDVELSGPANLIQQTLEAENFKVVTEDLEQLGQGQHYIKLRLEGISKELHYKLSPSSVNITIAELQTQNYPIEVRVNSDKLSPDYAVGNVSVNPQTVTLSGSGDKLQQISQVYVNVDIPSDASDSYTTSATVLIADSQGQMLDISADPKQVEVQVDIQSNTNTVPIQFEAINGRADTDYEIEPLTTHNTVLSGDPASIHQLNRVMGYVDVSQISKEEETQVDLELPAGVASMEPAQVRVKVTPHRQNAASRQEEATREANSASSQRSQESRSTADRPNSPSQEQDPSA
ncbi:CdaR family protein [Aerococcus sanguinicola]|uniref:YbbR-like domain-containing protein n=2 Tax=Aerococcaceae TaxID=186827 RepID=A0A0X8FB33_9LACT|nr:CdaR family protein [Aerococcus sanguinicola]AMB94064.1 hypothetical protein AWM72_04470 [Aerococcus sanguinicola]OFT92842.1 hypothetical protein HMPREF3090_08040 [Aerococcus sp. HMSC23C02]PKZ22154.1 hypothetical protein CYJ28_03285 [Aerococcus sanguinicola]